MKKPSVFGKYLLLERVNVGGMAEVFIAKAFGVEGFERILAIKKILPTMAEDQEFITMFIDEARISVQLSHANVVHIHDLGCYDDTYYIAMEYVAGRDLRTILERYRRRGELMPTAQAVFVASKMCEGLDYAHRKKDARGQELGIIHRDVSPQNILVSYEGEVKLIDFGIAKAANRMQKTQAGILKGKFGYMSPEQVRGMPIDRRSDIFAVGVILYEMLTGEKLFVGESDFSTLEKVRNADVPLPSKLNPDIPKGLEKVLLRALAREPEDRYQWASDLQEDLMRFLLAGDAMYSGKQLSGFMKEAFVEDLMREAEKMERFAAIQRPDELESSSGGAPPPRASKRGASAAYSAVRDREDERDESRHDTRDEPLLSALPRADVRQPAQVPYGDDDEEMDVAADKTQLVEPGQALSEALAKIRSEGFGPSSTEDTGSNDVGTIDDGATRLTENPMELGADGSGAPEDQGGQSTRVPTKQQVVIGEAQGYVGATVVGPLPGSREAGEDEPDKTDAGPGPGRPGRASSGQRQPPMLFPQEDVVTGPVAGRPGRGSSSPKLEPREARSGRKDNADVVKPSSRSKQRVGVDNDDNDEPVVAPRSRMGLLVVAGLALVAIIAVGAMLLSRKPTGLIVSVSPAQATVLVGNRKVTNNTLASFPPGDYELVATAPGHRPHTERVTVVAGEKPRVVTVVLDSNASESGDAPIAKTGPAPVRPSEPPPGNKPAATETGTAEPKPIQAEAKPSTPQAKPEPKTFAARFVAPQRGVEILVDGRPVGRTPDARLANLAVGKTYRYTARLAGYKPATGEFSSGGDPEVRVNLELEKEPERVAPKPAPRPAPAPVVKKAAPPPEAPRSKAKGKLACSSNPAGADIFVDGRPTGRQTPVPISNALELGVGAHKVVFKFGGKSSAPQVIDIKENEVSTLRNVLIE
jgi:serine/threonine protein kinase